MATTSNESDPPPNNTGNEASDGKDYQSDMFECNICWENARDAVISVCGHLFCWPCLHRWLEIQKGSKVCPACNVALSKDKIIPIYGSGNSIQGPRNNVPPRPAGQRTEPDVNIGFPLYNFEDRVELFAFGFLTLFNFIDYALRIPDGRQQRQDGHRYTIHFLCITAIFIIWLFTA